MFRLRRVRRISPRRARATRMDSQPGSVVPEADPPLAEKAIHKVRTETKPCDSSHALVMPLCVASVRAMCQ